eukprot:TRINITY_DN4000_c0_g1_i1.p1 TRINITY_DN4000_c0_g1~~TRINITY_DN4000_c0_g1_i1.p1  ORF type:complete len:129 (-),score=38.03 TRINITY_DN4000_c0_g1_i1:39-425(-)
MLRNIFKVRSVSSTARRIPVRRQVHEDNDYGRREKTMEDKNVRDHEKKLLEELAKRNEDMAKKLAQAEKKVSEVTGQNYNAAGNVTSHEEVEDKMLSLRKEILDEIRQLDDKLAELKYRVQRIERKVL